MNRTNHPRRGYFARSLSHYTRKNAPLLALGALFLAGALFGALLVRAAEPDSLALLGRLTGVFVQARRGSGLLPAFLASLGASLLPVGILFLLGFSAVSQPVTALLPLFRGLGAGFSMASLYARHGMAAFGFVSVLMLPGMLLSSAALLVCCRESLRLSGSLFRAMGGGAEKEFYSPRLYLARYFSAAAAAALSALLEAFLYFLFANSFLIE